MIKRNSSQICGDCGGKLEGSIIGDAASCPHCGAEFDIDYVDTAVSAAKDAAVGAVATAAAIASFGMFG